MTLQCELGVVDLDVAVEDDGRGVFGVLERRVERIDCGAERLIERPVGVVAREGEIATAPRTSQQYPTVGLYLHAHRGIFLRETGLDPAVAAPEGRVRRAI